MKNVIYFDRNCNRKYLICVRYKILIVNFRLMPTIVEKYNYKVITFFVCKKRLLHYYVTYTYHENKRKETSKINDPDCLKFP